MSSKKALKRKREKERKKELARKQKAVLEQLTKSRTDQNDVEVEYITEVPADAAEYESFQEVFRKFAGETEEKTQADDKAVPAGFAPEDKQKQIERKAKEAEADSEDGETSDEEDKPRLSNKKRKLRDRLTIAQLKQVVERPDLVELHDPNSPDPTLLVHLKSTRNTVPVPDHWMDKRRYLQGKRGIEKQPFTLPKAILDTGVSELRNQGKLTSLKQKQRQRMNPKLGRLDIDYQKLHAAFFKNMEKPRVTSHGDIYYLGKENEVKYRKHRPGALSKRLKNALHMMDNAPPPFLINMQRFGPPPSYPELKIPGLNAPIPPGCKYGYGEAQWGKPPVDENGYPLYGDPFGINSVYMEDEVETDKKFEWGSIEENVNYEEDLEDEEMEDDGGEAFGEMDEELREEEAAEALKKGTDTDESTADGLKTPDTVTIRKNVGIDTPETPVLFEKSKAGKKQLYQVLDKKESSAAGKGAMGSTHTYNITAEEGRQKLQNGASNKVSVALNEEELASLDEMTIKLKYDEVMKARKSGSEAEKADLKLARETSKRKKGRKKKDELAGFKF